MKIFILEDDPGRMLWFRERLIEHDITHADTCAQADRFMGGYDMVCFDHDLGGRQMTAHEDDGAKFAELVADRIGHAAVVIHSYNADGASRIQSLVGGVCAPFRGPLFLKYIDAIEANEQRRA